MSRHLFTILVSAYGIYYLECRYLFTSLQSFCFLCVFFIQSFLQVNTSLWSRNRRYVKKHDVSVLHILENRSLNFTTIFCEFTHTSERNYPANISSWINIASVMWINVERTLIRRWKWKKIRRRIFNVNTTSVPDVETTLHINVAYQRCFNVDSTLVRTISDQIGLWMVIDLQIDE